MNIFVNLALVAFVVTIVALEGCTGIVSLSNSPAAPATGAATLKIATSSIPGGSVGAPYSVTLQASGGTPPYVWSVASGALPGGLRLNSDTGAITGAPASPGSFAVTALVLDAKEDSSSAPLSLKIAPPLVPEISGIFPESGPTSGGTAVTISGSNFSLATAVEFGGLRAQAFQVISATEVRAVTPAEASGAVNVTVSDSNNQSVTAKNEFTFSSAPASSGPSVSVSSPLNNASVSGSVSLTASATDSQSTIHSVQFRVDGSAYGPALTSAPYAIAWDSTQAADGAHGISAVATDAAGKTATSATVDLTVKNATWNPASLGVPWAADFATIAANEIDVKQDSRLKPKATGNGATDDTAAIRAAIQLASATGGGVVYFPAGNYKIVASSGSPKGSPLVVPSRVVLRGSGASATRLYVNDLNAGSETDGIETWGGIDFQGASLSGMTDLGVYMVNPSSSGGALIWNRGAVKASEIFFNDLDVHLESSKNFWLESTNHLLVQNSSIDSTSAANGPVYMVRNSNFSFVKNKITYVNGRVQMQNNTNLLMQGNTLIRDAQNRDIQNGTAIESGGVELSFGNTISVLDNTIQTLNAPPDEAGDGEAIMTQQSNTANVLDAGSATSFTSTTLTDTKALWGPVTASRLGQYPAVIAILSGAAAGEVRTIQSVNTGTKTLTVSEPWSPVPAAGSLYSVFSWTLMHANIQGNTLTENPNGIVIYDGCYDCTVQNNTLNNSRQIILRTADLSPPGALYPESRRIHMVAMGAKILNNTVSNSSGIRPAYVVLDVEAFATDRFQGMAISNVQLSGNTIVPYSGDPSRIYPKAEITQDGLYPCFLFGPSAPLDSVTQLFQAIAATNNSETEPVTYSSSFNPFATKSCVSNSVN